MSNVLSSILDLLEVDFMSFLASKASLLGNETAKSDEGLFWKSSSILVWDIMHIESNLKHQNISFKYNIYLSSQALNGFWYTTKQFSTNASSFFLNMCMYERLLISMTTFQAWKVMRWAATFLLKEFASSFKEGGKIKPKQS